MVAVVDVAVLVVAEVVSGGLVTVSLVLTCGIVLGCLGVPLSLARIGSAVETKSCQMSAGKVPPSTGWPFHRVDIDTSLSGTPTHTATVICGVQPTNQASA